MSLVLEALPCSRSHCVLVLKEHESLLVEIAWETISASRLLYLP